MVNQKLLCMAMGLTGLCNIVMLQTPLLDGVNGFGNENLQKKMLKHYQSLSIVEGDCSMNEREFCYWLQGFMELTENHPGLTANQLKVINDHLQLVFKKETPIYNFGIDSSSTPIACYTHKASC